MLSFTSDGNPFSLRSPWLSPIFRTPGVSRMQLNTSDQAISPTGISIRVFVVEPKVHLWIRCAIRTGDLKHLLQAFSDVVSNRGRIESLSQIHPGLDADGFVYRVLHLDLERQRAWPHLGDFMENAVLERRCGQASAGGDHIEYPAVLGNGGVLIAGQHERPGHPRYPPAH